MIALRPATAQDGPRAAQIAVAVDVAEVGEPDYSLEDLQDEWREPGFELARDAIVAEAGGEVIGYAHVRSGGELLAVVDPARQGEGAGSALLDWAETRARERGERRVRQGVGARATAARTLLEARGYTVARGYHRLERELGEAGEAAFRAVRPDDALFPLWEAAFSRNPDYAPRSEQAWQQRHLHAHDVDLRTSRIEPGQGFTLVRGWEDGVAYIEELAVHPEHAGRGLGGRLLTATFAAARAHGYRRATLTVASDNPRARRLYARVGLRERWRIDDYHKPLPD